MTFIIIISLFPDYNLSIEYTINSIECPVVYYRDNWSFSCPALSYGSTCAEQCPCSNGTCYHVYKCIVTTSTFQS